MEKIIVKESSKNIRLLARQALDGKWKTAVLAALIFSLCMMVPTMLFELLFGSLSPEYMENMMYDPDAMMPATSFISSTYALLVTGAFTFGVSFFFIELFRKKQSEVGHIFSGFGYYGKTLGLYLFMSLFVALWTCLLIIPGIIASFRYSQAFYILADDPSKGIRQCMNESKAMMKGNKAKYFWMNMSFIGWYMLACLPVYVIAFTAGFTGALLISDIAVMTIFIIILIIPTVVVVMAVLLPYVMMANVVFFEMVSGRLRAAGGSVPASDNRQF